MNIEKRWSEIGFTFHSLSLCDQTKHSTKWMSSSENDERGLFEENNNRLLVILEFGFKWISTLDLPTETFFFSAVHCSHVFCLVKYGLREKDSVLEQMTTVS